MTAPRSAVGPIRVRTPRMNLVAVLALAICVIPLASASPWLAVLWALPLLAIAYLRRVGVDVDAEAITVRALLGSRRLPWSEVAGLRIGRRNRLFAVLRSGGAVRLPVLRLRHLSMVSAASGGAVPDPDAPAQ